MNLSTYFESEPAYMDPGHTAQPNPPDVHRMASSTAISLNTSIGLFYNGTSNLGLTTVAMNSTVDMTLDMGSRVTLIMLYTITSVAAVIGNTLAIVIFVKGHRSRTELRPFLINLAVADLIMAIICIPFTFTYQILEKWIFSAPMCPIVSFLQQMAVTASVSTNMAVGVDRFFAITYPLKKRLTTSRSKYVIILIWFIAIALNIVQIIVGRTYEDADGSTHCKEEWPDPKEAWMKSYTLFIMFLTYFLPLTILTVTYSMVGRILWRRHLPGHTDEMRDAQQLKSKRKIVKMLVIIVVLFGLCWLPLHTFFLLESFIPELMREADKNALYYACHWLAMANSFVNPVIYGFMNDSFRADLRTLVHSCPCWKHKITYRPGARRWKLGNNVGDIAYTTGDVTAARGLLTLKDGRDCWHNGNLYDHTSVLYLTKSC
ncbi:substance-K receptor-like [Haliotis cracherodii]|uniref:substance-K receptor-like n=1 Tax=Haliotis cracherodii TaxID=6455 RepID=UPI0039EBAE3F